MFAGKEKGPFSFEVANEPGSSFETIVFLVAVIEN
jgi:hypothetical protein